MKKIGFLSLFLFFLLSSGDELWDESNIQEFSAGKDEKALFPSIFNLATNSYGLIWKE